MGFLTRLFGLDRFGPSDPVSSPSGWFVKAIGGGKTAAGVAVSEHTALRLPVVYACVNRIANPIGQFPLRMYRTRAGGGKEFVTGAMHPFADKLGRRPNALMSSRTVRKACQSHALLWGNGYLEIERNGRGQAVGLYPLLPDRTRPADEGGEAFFRSRIGGQDVRIAHDDVIHIMDQSQDGRIGISQIAMHREAVSLALAMETFGGKFFANDAKSGGFLLHPGKLSSTAHQNLTRAVA